MDNEMIERCCIELAQQREQNGALPYSAYGKHAKIALKEDVISIIKAVREPIEKMKTLVTEDTVITDKCYYCGDHIEGWRTMIDSIIND